MHNISLCANDCSQLLSLANVTQGEKDAKIDFRQAFWQTFSIKPSLID